MLCAGIPERIYESLKTLCCLVNAAGPLQAHEIAAAANLPPAQTAKILQLMTWAGFVESRRGTKGGFWLLRPGELIRVTDVADFFAHGPQGQSPRKQDGILKALARATARCHKEFARITVADLAKVCGCEPTGPSRARRTVSTRQHRKRTPSKNATQKRSRG
jgi:DNA-binding IscR family transcriptional regulator